MLTIALAVIAVAFGLLAVKWWISTLAMYHLMIKRGIEPSDDDIKNSVLFVVRNLLRR